MYEVGVEAQFEAAHRLKGDFGPAARTHGHTYRVEALVRGTALQQDGTLLDITALQEALQEVTDQLHYRTLEEVELLQGCNTTAETVAERIAAQIAPRLSGLGLVTLRVRVWESPRAFAGFEVTL